MSILLSYAYLNLFMCFQSILKQQNKNLFLNPECYPETSYFPWRMSLFMQSVKDRNHVTVQQDSSGWQIFT